MIKSGIKNTIAFLVIVILFITIFPCFASCSESDLINSHKKLVVGYDSNVKPLQYFDEKTNLPSGISIDILKEISNICGIDFEFVPMEIEKEDVSNKQLQNIDLYACNSNYKTLKDKDYSEEYLSVPMMLVSDKLINLSDKLNIALYSFDEKNKEQLMKEFPQFTVKRYVDMDEVLYDFKSKKADAMFIPAYTYDELEQMNGKDSYSANLTDIKCRMKIGISEKLPREIISILNKSIARLDNDTVNTIIYTNIAIRAYDSSISKILKDNAWVVLGLLTIFFAILLIVIEASNRRLKKFLYVDSSTGKSSLAKFKIEARTVLNNAKSDEYMLVSIDVNNFKYINDIYGYDAGNEVLKIIADHIEKILPDSEIMLTARRSADNFVFISKTYNKEKILAALSDDKHLKMEVQFILGPDYNLELSSGVYVIRQPLKSISVMLDYANIAKKTVKGRVGNPIAEYTSEMDKHMELKKKITVGMDAGLQHGEFITCMQPKYSLEDESLIGAEVLVRWKHPDMGLLSPLLFIPLFEENGFIEKLDMYIFESTCKIIQKWNKSEAKIPRISVNISRVTLTRKDLVKELEEITEKYGLKTNCLEIEITEGTLERNTDRIIRIINELKAIGFFVSIDDFGSGYSSLSILKDMPADIIKIDKEFLSETFDSQKGKKIINSIIKMSKELNLETVAEGIETKEQAEVLKSMKCDVAQGYYFSKPMKPEEFEKLIISGS